MITIYVLVDPRSGDVRYVGQTREPLCRRVAGHRVDARRHPERPVSRWVNGLREMGYSPAIEVIQRVPTRWWEAAEMFWIAEMRRRGFALVNVTDGGAGRRR